MDGFDIFKIGVGPSSSHTMGPWRAAQLALSAYCSHEPLTQLKSIEVTFYGSLAKTGRGHGSDTAVIMGLLGFDPESTPREQLFSIPKKLEADHNMTFTSHHVSHTIVFNPTEHIRWDPQRQPLPHPNTMGFRFISTQGRVFDDSYLSLGGGFIQRAASFNIEETTRHDNQQNRLRVGLNYPTFVTPEHEQMTSATEILSACKQHALSLSQWALNLARKNKTDTSLSKLCLSWWSVMMAGIHEGCHTEGKLPGGLDVKRRAPAILKSLKGPWCPDDWKVWLKQLSHHSLSYDQATDWVSCFAMATNEVNASFGRVVTAPTNGSAGVIPAVLLYHHCFIRPVTAKDRLKFFAVAGLVGLLFKQRATLSAAAGGCQAEIGVSAAMAAAGLSELSGGDPAQVFMAAEIAMEHHLGLTCDPVRGLVQIPCIERNAMGAIKALTAAHLTRHSNAHDAKVSLDDVIATMWATAQDMRHNYKETSEGGLAVQISVNKQEC